MSAATTAAAASPGSAPPGALPPIPPTRSYKDALHALNSLQTNADVLEQQRRSGGRDLKQQLPEMLDFLRRVDITQEKMERLRVIHVTGSKGKGSTCAFTESLLRHQGFKTGLFTSPHLIEVRERIRINGRPLSQESFADHFWRAWAVLQATEPHTMPAYFRFTTLLAFQVFLEEKVDLAVFEVGIGGRFDATNVVHRVAVCGIASLGYEHTNLLGHTLTEIAFHKGGIIKNGAATFTVPQIEEGLLSLEACAATAKAALWRVPPLPSYATPSGAPISLGLAGDHQVGNASLALQLSREWLRRRDGQTLGVAPSEHAQDAPAFSLTEVEVAALASTTWPGRAQTVEKDGITYLLDGAHTLESCTACASWFASQQSKRAASNPRYVLLFNCTGDRDSARLLGPLADVHAHTPFTTCIFSPNVSRDTNDADHVNKMVSAASLVAGPTKFAHTWEELVRGKPSSVQITAYLDDALAAIKEMSQTEKDRPVVVLVVGSLHLVGMTLGLLGCEVQ